MQPELQALDETISELWWRVPLSLTVVISCLYLFGLAIGSIGEAASHDHPNKKHLNK